MNLVKLVQALSDSKAEFVIVGGWAGILHGSERSTNDLEVCFSREPANLLKIVAALAPFRPRPRGFPPDLPFVWDTATLRNATALTLITELGSIDLLGEIAGLGDYGRVKNTSILVRAFDRDVWTLDLPSLIESKKAAGRDKDLLAIPELESLRDADESGV